MEIEITAKAEVDLDYWKRTKNEKILKRIRELLSSILESPYKGIGKPEPLKYQLSGKWSRRIDSEHRLIYEISNNLIIIHSLKGHY
ncbi:Txe/YoeB family addiction module toxin [Emticicia sp. CRIBPO]|uniref:Txe/YoeB family addiction module toxin n=1 Tax=Emticicia sp. CRIBPO TaxID=2683258 RepID=UPI0014131D29|nr:Txe/YoeB family addiction module toxin [Emticicia sp. CRIBPO]NBA87772.1 Txe/YoeB family addiction module toxin [Emticicia sp. CRIBPO]